jgi:hypothetical protein
MELLCLVEIAYKSASAYGILTAAVHPVELYVAGSNQSALNTMVNLTGGAVFTLWLEGANPNLTVKVTQDYFPPPNFGLRVLHASPDTGAVDLLVNSSADFIGVPFEGSSGFVSLAQGTYELQVVPTNLLQPVYVDKIATFSERTEWTFLFVGLKNITANQTHENLDMLLVEDDRSLPMAGETKLRFIHASPNSPAVSLRINGISVFFNVSYRGSTNYTRMAGNKYTVELLGMANPTPMFSQEFDFRSQNNGASVYTLVAEGLSGKEPAVKIVAFLDAGEGPPPDEKSSKKKGGLSGLAIGLIVGGVAIFVLLVAGLGFVVYRFKTRYSGYSNIDDPKQP